MIKWPLMKRLAVQWRPKERKESHQGQTTKGHWQIASKKKSCNEETNLFVYKGDLQVVSIGVFLSHFVYFHTMEYDSPLKAFYF